MRAIGLSNEAFWSEDVLRKLGNTAERLVQKLERDVAIQECEDVEVRLIQTSHRRLAERPLTCPAKGRNESSLYLSMEGRLWFHRRYARAKPMEELEDGLYVVPYIFEVDGRAQVHVISVH